MEEYFDRCNGHDWYLFNGNKLKDKNLFLDHVIEMNLELSPNDEFSFHYGCVYKTFIQNQQFLFEETY